ncbi:MAG: cation:proton antiporter [Armatimonadota bacterium]
MFIQFFSDGNAILFNATVIFTAGLLFSLLARRLHLSPLLGYLLAGFAIGPYGLRLVLDQRNIQFLADVGVVLLMFALGVQLSLRHLLEVRSTAIVVGLIQIIVLILLGLGIGALAGLPITAGLVLGYAIALSSSVVLVRLLGERDESNTPFGRIALGISVMQDLMVVVMISTLPFLAQAAITSFAVLWIDLVKAVFFVLWIIVFARWVAPFILNRTSATGSREVFLTTVVVLSLGSAIFSSLLGFSYALGGFLAGLVISESLFSQAVLAEVIPLRDVFGLLFFVSLGMLVNPAAFVHSGGLILLLLVAAVVGKALTIFLSVQLFHHHPYTALIAGLLLSQIGEFSFVIAREAESLGVITAELTANILSVAILSIALTPLLLSLVRWLYRRYRLAGKGVVEDLEEMPALGAMTPVLLCGYGRVGRTIAQALDTFRIPFMVVDIDRQAIENLINRGIHAVYGDAANFRLLKFLGAEKYQLGVIAVSDRTAVHIIAQHLHRLNPSMRLLLRSHTDRETAQFFAMGVDGVVHVELEASLAFVEQVLTTADVDPEIVAAYLNDIRIGHYEALQPPEREE